MLYNLANESSCNLGSNCVRRCCNLDEQTDFTTKVGRAGPHKRPHFFCQTRIHVYTMLTYVYQTKGWLFVQPAPYLEGGRCEG